MFLSLNHIQTLLILVLAVFFVSAPCLGNVEANADPSISTRSLEDSLLEEEFHAEIKREADSIWKAFEAAQDPNGWPRATETTSSITFNYIPWLSIFILLLLGVSAFLIYGKKEKVKMYF